MAKTLGLMVAKVLGEFFFVYGLLGWLYGVAIQITHPAFLPFKLSHLTPWIRVDTFTMLSFVISAAGFLMWRIAKELSKP